MSLYINSITNDNSLFSQEILGYTLQQTANSQNLLSSASTNATNSSGNIAGFAISQILQENANGFSQGMANANQGVSMTQVATSGMNQTLTMLQQMQSLAVEGASGIYSSTQLNDLQTQFSQLQTSVNNIASNTTFNGISLLQNSSGSLSVIVGNTVGNHDTVSVPLFNTTASSLGIGSSNVSSVSGATAAMSSINTAINTVSNDIAKLANAQSNLQSAASYDAGMADNLTNASSVISSVDYAATSSNLAMNSILSQMNIALMAQANTSSQSVMQLLSLG